MVETITPVVYGGRTVGRGPAPRRARGDRGRRSGRPWGRRRPAEAPWGRAGALALARRRPRVRPRELPGSPRPCLSCDARCPTGGGISSPWPLAATLYGAGLGIGFFTYLHGTLVAVAVRGARDGGPVVGALIVAPFGLVRGLSARARRRIEGARGRRPPGGSAELDVRAPPVGAERRDTGDLGSCGRRLRNGHGWRLGPGGGSGPRRGVRMGRRLEAGRMESVAPNAVRTCAPSERRAARGVGGAGSGVPRPDPLGSRARARRGRRRARIDRRVLARSRPTRRARRRPSRLRLLRSCLDRRAARAHSQRRSRGHGGRCIVARRS